MKNIIKILLIIAASTSLFAQQTLTLEKAIEIALANNYSVLLSKKQTEIAENNVSRGNAGQSFSLDVAGGAKFSSDNTKTKIVGVEGEIAAEGAETNNYNGSVTLSRTLFDGMGMFIAYDRLKALLEKSEIELQIAMEDMIRDLVNVYYSIVRQKENLEILESNLSLTKSRYDRVTDRVEYGAASSIELLNAEVDMNADSTEYLLTELELQNAKRMLNFVLGNSYNESYVLADEVSFEDLGSINELIDKADNLNSFINRALQDKEINQYDKELIVASMWPRLNASAGYSYTRQESEGGFMILNESRGWNVGLNLSWNVYNGLQTQIRKENAEVMLRMQDITIERIKSQIEMNLRNAYDNYQKRLAILEMEEQSVTTAEENYERTQNLYDLGNVTSVELRQAQINLLRSKQRLNNSKYLAKTAETEVMLITGQLLQD